VSRVDPVAGKVTAVKTIDEVKSRGEGGLLGMALHPDFLKTPQVFVAFDYEKGDYKGKVVRYNYNGTTLIDPVVLIDNIPAAGIHNGSRLIISPDRKLFITTGDASHSRTAQDKSSLSGKVFRINLDGSIPGDNPFPNSAVWSFGHRNPQGLVFAKNRLYASEHGPSNDDEVNIIQKGRNYGWPNVEGFCNERDERSFCSANNVAEPLYAWTPTLAVCGWEYYNSNSIGNWKNSLLLTTLKESTLYQLQLNEAGDKIVSAKRIFKGEIWSFA
jgi:glucose/arabinose dehydrogenase